MKEEEDPREYPRVQLDSRWIMARFRQLVRQGVAEIDAEIQATEEAYEDSCSRA